MKRVARGLVTIAIVLVAVAIGAGGGIWIYSGLFSPTYSASEPVPFDILPGESLRTVAVKLEREGHIPSSILLELYGRIREYDGRLQAGRYLVSDNLAPVTILQKIVDGEAVFDEIRVTIPEGWTIREIQNHFSSIGLFENGEFAAAATMGPLFETFDYLSFLDEGDSLEGYLFPETYKVFADSEPESVIRRMLATFEERVVAELGDQIRQDMRSLEEIVTLASIVQEEAGEGHMAEVAGVFWKRLQDGQRLESDATVNYVLGTSKRQPTFADTRVEDPYNTYRQAGLPPGPIGNPGLEAIRAALLPQDHPYYYFLHKPDGTLVMSRTFQEHLENKARYLD